MGVTWDVYLNDQHDQYLISKPRIKGHTPVALVVFRHSRCSSACIVSSKGCNLRDCIHPWAEIEGRVLDGDKGTVASLGGVDFVQVGLYVEIVDRIVSLVERYSRTCCVMGRYANAYSLE